MEFKEIALKNDLLKFVSKETGWDTEKSHRELNDHRFASKNKSLDRKFDYSSLSTFAIPVPRIMVFISEQTGKSLEQCYMEVNRPPIHKAGRDSSSFRTFTPGEAALMSGVDCHLGW